MNVVPPVIVAEGLDLIFFKSKEAAEQWLEPWWIEAGLGKIYDGQGRVLLPSIRSNRVSIAGLEERSGVGDAELMRLLREFLMATGHTEDVVGQLELSSLIALCTEGK